ncbi:MAG TPA: exosome complex RNA-binding protein Rrp4 [Candidatus Nanoarchaeia archaeon]|nr:exosome complex RNA-binding protein Rrp4 [Candidatus Nanoarchaeia archaeon]
MGKLNVKENDIVVPGEVLAEGMDYLPSQGTYRLEDNVRAGMLGMVRIEGKVIKLMQLNGRYVPRRYDTIVCPVIDVLMSGWRVNTNSAYEAVLPIRDASSRFIPKGADLTKFFALGDYLVCKISNVTSQKLVDVSMNGPGLQKLEGGRIFEVNPHKVPRIIGKEGSMISMIKYATGCRIVVGQNGLVWINGEPDKEVIAYDAIRRIEREATLPGLTDRIKTDLEKKLKIKIESAQQFHEPQQQESQAQRDDSNKDSHPEEGGSEEEQY